ncbi:hypothetical protein [Flavobacterium agricola]|nr:hypothetical protein [Flavobacterium agricola]
MMPNNKIPVYFMPGLAASSKIFEHIRFDAEVYDFFYLEWKVPQKTNR